MENIKRYLRTGLITLAASAPSAFGVYSFAETRSQLISSANMRLNELNVNYNIKEAEERWRKCNLKVRCPPEEGCPTFHDCNNQYDQELEQARQKREKARAAVFIPLFCERPWRTGIGFFTDFIMGIPQRGLESSTSQALELLVINHEIKMSYCK